MANAAVAAPNRMRGARAAALAPTWALVAFGALFLVSAGLAAANAFDRGGALAQMAALAFGVGICGVAAWLDHENSRRLARLPLVQGAGLVALLAVLALSAYVIFARPDNGGPSAAALTALIPLALLAALPRPRQGAAAAALTVLAVASLVAGVVALWLAGERSAIAALAIGTAVAAVELALCRSGREGAVGWFTWATIATGALVLGILLVAGAPLAGWLGERVALWKDTLPLIADYRFTGSGLASTEMVFASYALLTHVPYVAQVHNLYLQVAMEMGLVGLIALLGMMAAAVAATLQALRHGGESTRTAAGAVLCALLAQMALGLVDAEATTGPLVITLFAPIAAAFVVHAAARADAWRAGALEFPPRQGQPSTRYAAWAILALVGVLPVLLVWGWASQTRLQAAWLANRAALLQSRVELTDYANADWAFQDAIRRKRAEALAPVMRTYGEALHVDAASETAHRRLGQIELSLGNVAAAGAHLGEAHRLAPSNRATAQLLGEVLALQGDPEAAAALWHGLTLQHNQLDTRLGWYSALENPADFAGMERAVTIYSQGGVQ